MRSQNGKFCYANCLSFDHKATSVSSVVVSQPVLIQFLCISVYWLVPVLLDEFL